MPIDKALVRRAKKSGGSAYVIEEGPSNVSYYDPETGQEFIGLPRDPWSLELYMRGGIHGNRPKLLPGRAPVELRTKWEEYKVTLEDPADEHLAEAERMLKEREVARAASTDALTSLVEKLGAQVAELTARLNGTVTPEQLVAQEISSEGPRQLEMILT